MTQLKLFHYLLLATIAAGTFMIIASYGNFLGGLLASSAIVALISLLWSHPKARAFMQQHYRPLNLTIGILFLLVLGGRYFLPASHPLRESISAILGIAMIAMMTLHFIPESSQA
jgi:hypothetical protein